MTEVQFHVNVADPVLYGCRLLRKAVRQRARVAVTGSARTLAELDRQLWIFEPEEFLAHRCVADAASADSSCLRAPVWLVEDAAHSVDRPVLVNLGVAPTPAFEKFDRVIEIVSQDEADRDAARQRWRHYLAQGLSPVLHEASA
jgi:DNA polymerase-3 subunit chi